MDNKHCETAANSSERRIDGPARTGRVVVCLMGCVFARGTEAYGANGQTDTAASSSAEPGAQ